MNKTAAYITAMGCLMFIFLMMWASKDATQYGAIILGVVSMTTAFIGGKCVDNHTMGKNFNQDYWDATHKQEESK